MNRAEANRLARGEILRLVRKLGTNGVSHEGIEKILVRAGRLGIGRDLEEHLLYLVDRGYLRRQLVTDDLSGVKRWMCWITADGIALLDELVDGDPGVEVVC